jgi:HK97 family phage major capsid protein
MSAEPTLHEVHQAVGELRTEFEKKSIDPSKVVKINDLLDTFEEKVNQPLVAAQKLAEGQAEEIKAFQESLEKAGVAAGEQKERLNALEIELARAAKPVDPDYRDKPEYKAVQAWVKGGERRITVEEKALLRSDTATDGGVLVTSEMDSQITKKIVEIDPIRTVARVRTIGSKTLEMPMRSTIPSATYEGEAEEGAESASTYGLETVTPFRQTFTVPITLDQLQDSAFDMEAEIMTDAGEAFAYGEGNGFVVGTGHKQPEGFTVNAVLRAASRETAAQNVLDPEALILLTGDLKRGYNPVYVMNRGALAFIRTMRGDAASAGDKAGQFLWMPGMSGAVASTINGYPYILAPSMPDHDSGGSYSVAFGDFRRGYTIIDRTGLSVVRDEFTQKKKGIVEFTLHRWNTGRVTLTEPIKLLLIKA